MKLIFTACLGLLALLLSCKPDLPPPSLTITAQENEFGAVLFKLKSENATAYSWDFGDGSPMSTNREPIHSYPSNGTFTASLKATGPWGETTTSQAVTVVNVRGSVMFWMTQNLNQVEVFFDDVRAGVIYNFFPKGVIYCATNGCVQVNNLREGDHTYTAREVDTSEIKWRGTVKVTGGACLKQELKN